MSSANIVERLAVRAREHPRRDALILAASGQRLTYLELWNRVGRVSEGLAGLGLRAGDRALVFVPMSLELYVVLLAVLKLGAVAVFIDPWASKRQIAAFARFAEPRAFLGIGKSHLLRLLSPALRRLPIAVTMGRRFGRFPAPVTFAELNGAPPGGIGEVVLGSLGELFRRGRRKSSHSPPRDLPDPAPAARLTVFPSTPSDPALVTFTSGSSGEPKGTNRTHGFLVAQHEALVAEFPPREGDVDLTMFPVFALNNLASGVPTVIPAMDFRRVDRVDGRAAAAQMRAYGVTTAVASPPFFDRLCEAISRGETAPALRRVISGGAPVTNDQLADWRRALPETEILLAYGSTEAEPIAHLTAEERLHSKASGLPAGRPCSCVEAKLVRIHRGPIELGPEGWDAWEVVQGEVGELVVTGDHVAKEYFNHPRAFRENKIVDAAGTVWHRTGDTGFFATDGCFWLAGRVHSTIFRRGTTVHPLLVELAARGEDERIRRAAAVGLPDAELGERVVVVVEGDGDIEAEVRARLSCAGIEIDELIVSAKPLPVDPRHNSKIDYPRLRKRLLEER